MLSAVSRTFAGEQLHGTQPIRVKSPPPFFREKSFISFIGGQPQSRPSESSPSIFEEKIVIVAVSITGNSLPASDRCRRSAAHRACTEGTGRPEKEKNHRPVARRASQSFRSCSC